MAKRCTIVRRSLGDARALPGTSILTSAADFKPEHRSSMPSDEPTPPRRAVVSFHKTSSKRRNVAAPLRRISKQSYMYDTYPPYLDQGLIQAVSTVSGPRYSRYSMYCISLYLDRGLIQLIQYVSDCIHAVSYM